MKETPSAGKLGEEMAVSFLMQNGYQIDERNWHGGREGEIDIIARQGDLLVFVEVKTRFSDSYGQPVQAVGPAKQRQIGRLAKKYLYLNQLYGKVDCRFDVVSIKFSNGQKTIEHIEDAFRINTK